MNHLPIVLASSSIYRKRVLEQLKLSFETYSPDIDETPKPNESPEALALRLSEQKAKACEHKYPEAIIIGSDQVCHLNGQILHKPGNHEQAAKQLSLQSGKSIHFVTGLAVYNSQLKLSLTDVVTTSVTFRQLSDDQIENYLHIEQPYDCCGSFKSEGLGAALIAQMDAPDPNALIGLPIFKLIDRLLEYKVELFQ